MANGLQTSSSTWERRLHAEWDLLQAMAQLNPSRLDRLDADDTTFRVTLKQTPAPTLDAFEAGHSLEMKTAMEHTIRIEYRAFFPAVPMEVYLDQPVAHPNIHPESGFICLWQKHQVSNTVEHALHKTVAILGWKLRNSDPLHVMQPGVSAYAELYGSEVAAMLNTVPLNGVQPVVWAHLANPSWADARPRKRLS